MDQHGFEIVSDDEALYEVRERTVGRNLLRVQSGGPGRPRWEVVGQSGYIRAGGYARTVEEAEQMALEVSF